MTNEYLITMLKEAIDYDPLTGICLWKHRPIAHFSSERRAIAWNARFAGKVAGGKTTEKHKCVYRQLIFNKKSYLLHRLIWLITYGEFPILIDHINGNGLDNSLANLRSVSHSENMKNIQKHEDRGLPVGINKCGKLFQVTIDCEGKRHFLGSYLDIEEAKLVRKNAQIKFGFHPNHGQVRKS